MYKRALKLSQYVCTACRTTRDQEHKIRENIVPMATNIIVALQFQMESTPRPLNQIKNWPRNSEIPNSRLPFEEDQITAAEIKITGE
jgi:hypothetical protein